MVCGPGLKVLERENHELRQAYKMSFQIFSAAMS